MEAANRQTDHSNHVSSLPRDTDLKDSLQNSRFKVEEISENQPLDLGSARARSVYHRADRSDDRRFVDV